jgi:hypothetical protein
LRPSASHIIFTICSAAQRAVAISSFMHRFQREWSVYNGSRSRSVLPRVMKETPHETHLLTLCATIRPRSKPSSRTSVHAHALSHALCTHQEAG